MKSPDPRRRSGAWVTSGPIRFALFTTIGLALFGLLALVGWLIERLLA